MTPDPQQWTDAQLTAMAFDEACRDVFGRYPRRKEDPSRGMPVPRGPARPRGDEDGKQGVKGGE